MSQNIKNNLFRFVTLRSPQLIDEKDKQLGFVYHPHKQSGIFYPPLNAALEGEKKQALIDSKNSFASSPLLFEKKADVKEVNEDLYNFSSWLMRNKNALSYAEISNNLNSAETLGDEDLYLVWDNLIYQTIAKKSVYVREALIQLLIANKFLEHFNKFSEGLSGDITFTEDQEKQFKRFANASVVISKELLLETYNDEPVNTKTKRADTKHQKRLSDLLTAKYDRVALKKLTGELKDLQKSYEASEAAQYKTALDNHQKDVDLILNNGTVQLVDQWDVEKQVYIQVEKLVHEPLPEFTYTKAVEIDTQTLQAGLSDLSYKYITDHKLDNLTSYNAIFKEVKLLLKEKSNKVEQLLPKTSKSVLKGGVNMRLEDPFNEALSNFGDADSIAAQMIEDEVSNEYIPLYVASEIDPKQADSSSCYKVSVVASASPKTKEGNRDWSFVLGVTYNDEISTIASVQQSLSFTNDASAITSSALGVFSTLPNHTKVRLFGDLGDITKPDQVGNPILTVTITLTNGTELELTETIVMLPSLRSLSGVKVLDFSCESEEETPEESVSTFGKIYGVTNLGIADFRRVEQEVCCYVPGEVSHIENVMAREYKERSTRSLTSSEFTTEQTDERERENLTDTTSTERNEMQSEVASVLNEDQSQSYGGNANVSGGKEPYRFQVGSHFDSASASSSSNSNSQAQTYAQEVTERAMERIVQKTQTKRTSRILKEFEENTSHGFDNRKGIEHVTGVYRWVDKIYKNTLINYGKRLMYEFAIPEPSKFFQEAVWKDIDETGQTESGVILPELPVHPNTLGLTSPSVLALEDGDNEKGYQKLAARYNAEVNTQPAETIMLSKAFDLQFNSQDDQTSSLSDYLEIESGYEAINCAVKGRIFSDSDNDRRVGRISISVGDKQIGDINTSGTREFFDTSEDYSLDNIRGELAVSASSYDMAACSFNVSATCARTQEFLEQWQNETYNAIMEAYYDRLQEYNDAMREFEANNGLTPDAEKLTFNPLQNKSIMLRELKRVAIELIIDQARVSKNNYNTTNQDTGVSTVKRTEAFQTHASTVKFFEQAFDWDIMAYVFYPYFYADEKDWKKLFQLQDAADPLFQAFLQSGMARTVVPVRPGFEDTVNWYMTTGEIWNGQGLVVDQDDDLYVSVAEEMQTVDGVVEGTWETRLPTALTVLQAGSIGLKVEGLPCNDECAQELFESDKSPIEQTDTLIGGEDGVGSDYVSEPITVE
ncbi:hypothetical protein [Winogradskyella luteola]|uniref:Uncharacterized protein n=1 Tax=Winogradskyella luteola TaxID=2828330 RepID=A0A9X1JN29_9FLAO|nr:hypothetical protein [Winogradskyella luteola]MBV7269110.1 hypothetical protein [Winogradskyella luteola]